MSKLKFTNDCDPDLTICELQHENDRLVKEIKDMHIELDDCGKSNADLETRLKELSKQIEDAEDVISEIYKDSNPTYLVEKKAQYFKEYTDE